MLVHPSGMITASQGFENGWSGQQKQNLQKASPKYLKYYDNGSVNKYASRRVEIKIKIKSKDEQHLSEKLKNNGAQVKRSK